MTRPEHVAIIMDGNGRWAVEKQRPRTFGHIKGAQTVKSIVTEAAKLDIKYLTLFAFSTENWRRPASEVDLLMRLLRRYLDNETENLMSENIRFRYIGNIAPLPEKVRERLSKTVDRTKSNTGMTLVLALNYGGRQEIVNTVRKILRDVKDHHLNPEAIDESIFSQYLDTAEYPDPDLLIRTSGESRISNFLLWQLSYTELYFTKKYWPDFKEEDLQDALNSFERRNRRFGATTPHTHPPLVVLSE